MEKVDGKVQNQPCLIVSMMENTNLTRSVVKGCIRGQVATFTKETILTMREVEVDRCSGPMVVCTKVSGSEVSSME